MIRMRNKLIFLIFFIVLVFRGYSQDREIIELWPGIVPGEEKGKIPAVISDNSQGDVVRISEVTNPVLEVFEAANPAGPAVVVCPGGAYNMLAIDKEGYEIADWLNGLGITAFVLQYRVPQKQFGALQDVQRAVRVVRSLSGKYGLDPEKTGVIGFSAGGSLAARLSTRFCEETYPSVDAADKLSARPDFTLLIYPAYLDQGPDSTLTTELTITTDTPPMYIFATADDRHANSSLVMTRALRRYSIPVELHVMPEGGHGYGLRPGTEAASLWPEWAERWLNTILKN